MGDVAERFRQISVKTATLSKEPVPDPASEPKAYLEYQKRNRRADREYMHARTSLAGTGIPLDEIQKAYEKIGAADVFTKQLENFRSRVHWNFREYLQKKYPEALESLSEDDKRVYRGSDINAVKAIHERLLAEGKIPPHAMEDHLSDSMINYGFVTAGKESEQQFVEALEEVMTPEQKQRFTDATESYTDPLDYVAQEQVSHPYAQRTAELKERMPADIAADPVQKAAYENALDRAAEQLDLITPGTHAELNKQEQDNMIVEAARMRRFREVDAQTLENGRFKGFYEMSENTYPVRHVAKGREQDFDDLIKGGSRYSDRTKEGVRKIIVKMREMGLDKFPHSASGEDAQKVYGFNKLVDRKSALKEALGKEDPKEIIRTQQEYESTLQEYRELYQIAREYFKADDAVHPGNMDSIRNQDIPFELAGDLHTTAQINALFLTFVNVQDNHMDLEQYLENPTGQLLHDALDKLKARSFAEITKGLSLEDCISAMTQTGAYEMTEMQFVGAVPILGFGRALNMPAMLEGDPELRLRNGVIGNLTQNDIFSGGIQSNDPAKFGYFSSNVVRTEGQRRAKVDTLRNLMLVSDADRNMNALFAGEPETDFMGRVIADPFDAEAYIARKPVDYAGIMDRAERTYRRFEEIDDRVMKNTNTDTVLQAMQQLYQQVLMAHPEDADKPEYQQMKKAMDRTYERLNDVAAEELRERMRINREIAGELLEENRIKYRMEHDPVAYLREKEAKAVRTGDYREFARDCAYISCLEGLMPAGDLREELDDYFCTLFERDITDDGTIRGYKKGDQFYASFVSALYEDYMENMIEQSRQADELAGQIRRGVIPVHPAYEEVRKDVRASRIIANSMLDGSEEDRRIVGATNLLRMANDVSLVFNNGVKFYEFFAGEAKKKVISQGKQGTCAAQREAYFLDGTAGFENNMAHFGGGYDTQNPKPLDTRDTFKQLQNSMESAVAYYREVELLRRDAAEKLAALKTLKEYKSSNSTAFTKMYDSLEAVSKLDAESTPLQINQAVYDLREAADGYKEKIDYQIFAKKYQNGIDRYEAAVQLKSFAEEKYKNLLEYSLRDMCQDEKVSAQLQRCVENMTECRERLEQEKPVVMDSAEYEKQEQERRKKENIEVVQAKPEAGKDSAHRKLQPEEVQDLLGGMKKQARRNAQFLLPDPKDVKENGPFAIYSG